jgi:hypothetical protein
MPKDKGKQEKFTYKSQRRGTESALAKQKGRWQPKAKKADFDEEARR